MGVSSPWLFAALLFPIHQEMNRSLLHQEMNSSLLHMVLLWKILHHSELKNRGPSGHGLSPLKL